MENNKKGYWLKGIFTAIIVAAFCFVLSLCITTKDSKVEAEASDFSANFNLNETLTKKAESSYLYSEYSYLKNNTLSIDMNYTVDCQTTSNEDDIQAQIDKWQKIMDQINDIDDFDWSMLMGSYQYVIQQHADEFGYALENMSNLEQAEYVQKNATEIKHRMALYMIETLGLTIVKAIVGALGVAWIPIVGPIIAVLQAVEFITAIVMLMIVQDSLFGIVDSLAASNIWRQYNYCINAYEYIESYDESTLTDFNFVLNNASLSFTDYERIATNLKVPYNNMNYYAAISHSVTAYTMRIEVTEANGLSPLGGGTWTEFFFPGYSKTLPNGNSIQIGAGDRTDALFCNEWNESKKLCMSGVKKVLLNDISNYSFNASYALGSKQEQVLSEGIYTFDFVVKLIPVGSNTVSFSDDKSYNGIIISNETSEIAKELYGNYSLTQKYGIYTDAASIFANAYCSAHFLPPNVNSKGEYIGNYYDEEYKIISVHDIGEQKLYCFADRSAKLGYGNFENLVSKKVDSYIFSYSISSTITAAIESQIRNLASNYAYVWNFLKYVDYYDNLSVGNTVKSEISNLLFVVDYSNPFAPDVKITSSSLISGYYSNDSVTVTASGSKEYTSAYSSYQGDATIYFNEKGYNYPAGAGSDVDSYEGILGSGIVSYKYAVYHNVDEKIISEYNSFVENLASDDNSNYSYKWKMLGEDNYSWGLLPFKNSKTENIMQSEIFDWLNQYQEGISGSTIKIDINDWNDMNGSSVTFTEDGVYYVFVVGVDYAGNISAATGTKFIIDTTKPMIDLTLSKLETVEKIEKEVIIPDATEQLAELKDGKYYKNGYIITKSEVKYLTVDLYDLNTWGSGIELSPLGNYKYWSNNYKICITYLNDSASSTCLKLSDIDSISELEYLSPLTPIDIKDNVTADSYFDKELKIFKTIDNKLTAKFMFTDGQGNANYPGASAGPFRVNIYANDVAGNVNELSILVVSNIERWTIEPEVETQVEFDFNDAVNPITDLQVTLHYPKYIINESEKLYFDLNDSGVMEQKYMLVGASDRVKFYTNWDNMIEICTDNPNDTRCGRKTDELKVRFENITASSNIVDLLSNNDDLYENQYLFQHFQIKIPTKNTTFFYVLLQEFEFSTNDLIKQLVYASDEYDRIIGDISSDESLNILSTTNGELRLVYTDYSKLDLKDEYLDNFNFMNKFTLGFDLMQIAISDPEASAVRIEHVYNLDLKWNYNDEVFNKSNKAGDFTWVKDNNFNIYTFNQCYVEETEEGYLRYYIYINLNNYASEYDLGQNYAINNVAFTATKNNAYLGSSKDYTNIPSSTDFMDVDLLTLKPTMKYAFDGKGIYVPMMSSFVGTNNLMYKLGFSTFEEATRFSYFELYYEENGLYIPTTVKQVSADGTGNIVMAKKDNNYQVYAYVKLFVYLENSYLKITTEELFNTFRLDSRVAKGTFNLATGEFEEKTTSTVIYNADIGKYVFEGTNEDAYLNFKSFYVEVTSEELLSILINHLYSEILKESVSDGMKLPQPIFNNFYVNTEDGSEIYSLSNSYTLINKESYVSIYAKYNDTADSPAHIPSTGKFKFDSETMGHEPQLYTYNDGTSSSYKEVYWTNASSLKFSLSDIENYENAFFIGPTLKYQYGVISTADFTDDKVIGLFAHYNDIDLLDWFECRNTTDADLKQCQVSIQAIKASILDEYYNYVSDAYKSKIDEYIKVNKISKGELDRTQLIEISAYDIEYEYLVAKAFLDLTETLFTMIQDNSIGSKATLTKWDFVLSKFENEINKRNSMLHGISANTSYYYRNYHYNETYKDYKHIQSETLTLKDLYATALSLYMNYIATPTWSEAPYCYVSNTSNPCTLNSTGVIDASALISNYTDGEYVLVYRSVDVLGRSSLNYKTIHFFSDVPTITIDNISEIVLTDTNSFYSTNTGEATLNLSNLQTYLFGKENIKAYISKWFAENDVFFNNIVEREVCIITNGETCKGITNDQVISMEIGKVYNLQFTLKDKASNVLKIEAPFQLIYDVEPTFDITIEDAEEYKTNKDVNVVVQYRSIAGLDYDRTLKSITLADGTIVDAANGVYYYDLSGYKYSASTGVHKNGTITVGSRVIDIYADANKNEYSTDFIAFLNGIKFSNNLLIGENGYYFNVNKEDSIFILAVDMTKPIQSSATDVGRSRVYSDIITVANIDTTAPVVSFDDQFRDIRESVDNSYYFSSQSVHLYFKDYNGVGISGVNTSFISVKPVNDSSICAHDDKECIKSALERMTSVPSLEAKNAGDYIWVDITPNDSRPGLITYYVSAKDDLGNAVYYRYDIQMDITAPQIDTDTTYISELDENGFVQSASVNIMFNSIKDDATLANSYEVVSPLDKIVIKEKIINSTEEPIETVIQCNGNCGSTMKIPYIVRNDKVNLTVSLYDYAGNKSVDYTMTVFIDSIDPQLTVEVRSDQVTITDQPIKVLVVATDNFSFYEGSFVDENEVTHYDIEVMKDDSNVWTRINNNYEYIITDNGTYTFRANDKAKNYVEKTITITNIDNKAPILDFAPNGGPAAQSHTIIMRIADELSHISLVRYCWVTKSSNITECLPTTEGQLTVPTLSNETSKEIPVTKNTGENAYPDGEYVMVVYVEDEWGNGKHYTSNSYILDSKKPSITPNQALVSDSTKAVIDHELSNEVGSVVYRTELPITNSNNISHLFSNKAMVTITGESNKELLGQWVDGFDGEVLSSPITFDNIRVKDGENGDYYYLKFFTTYEDSNKDVQTAVVYLLVHVIDASSPNITLISGPSEIEVNKEGEDYEIPGISINDVNDGTLYENQSLRKVYFIPHGQYVPTLKELQEDMNLATHQYIQYSSSTHISIKEIGTYLVYYVASDNASNTSVALRTITIIDDKAPVLEFENELLVDNFLYVKEEGKKFNIYDYKTITDNYDNLTAENVVVSYEYKPNGGTYNQLEYYDGALEVLGYHKFTYTLVDASGNEKIAVRELHTVNISIKYINGENAGNDVSLAENDSFIIKGAVRFKENGLTILINDKPIDEVASPVYVSSELCYDFSANGKQNVKVIDDIGNEVVYSLYMLRIDEINPEEQTELKVLIDKNLITSTKQIVVSSSDFSPNRDKDGNIVSYSINITDYNVNIDGEDASTKEGDLVTQNVILFSLFCDNVTNNGGVKCSSNYLELTLQGKMLNSSSAIKLTPTTDTIVFSTTEYDNMVANGNRMVMLLVTKTEAEKVEKFEEPVEEKKISDSSISTMMIFGVPSVIALIAIIKALKFKKSVKTV